MYRPIKDMVLLDFFLLLLDVQVNCLIWNCYFLILSVLQLN